MYGPGGERDLEERDARPPQRLRGRAPGADRQRRLPPGASTTCGARCSTPSTCTRARATRSTSASGRSSVRQVEMAIENWRKPDRGIWEVRGEPKHFTSSKMFCWVACDRGARLAEIREDWDRAERWQAAADEIHADICEHGVDEPRRVRPALRDDRARRRAAADAAAALPAAPTTRGCATPCSRSPTS